MEVQDHRFRDYRPSGRSRSGGGWFRAPLLVLVFVGCGTTRSSDTTRTATEQVLISDAIDRAVASLNVERLSGQLIYFDDQHLHDAVDSGYLISSIRQHLLAGGCILKDEREDADFVVEGRSGAIGTNRHDLLFGIPSTNVPQIFPLQGIPAAIPEVPIAKRRDQRGVAKIAVFAYHRESGRPVWQSGISLQESTLNDVWLLGAGPFQHGTIRNGPMFAGSQLHESRESVGNKARGIAQEITFANPAVLAGKFRRMPAIKNPAIKNPASKSAVELAGFTDAVDGPAGQAPEPINQEDRPAEFHPEADSQALLPPVIAPPQAHVD